MASSVRAPREVARCCTRRETRRRRAAATAGRPAVVARSRPRACDGSAPVRGTASSPRVRIDDGHRVAAPSVAGREVSLVLGAGSGSCGWWCRIHARSFFGPVCGRRERSAATLTSCRALRHRATKSQPTCRLTPNSRHNAAKLVRPSPAYQRASHSMSPDCSNQVTGMSSVRSVGIYPVHTREMCVERPCVFPTMI